MRLALLLFLAFAGPASGTEPPTLKLPAEVQAKPATITEIKAETTGKVVEWVPLTPGLSVRECECGRVLLFAGPPGKYELLAYTALGDVPSKPARVVIVIDGDNPGPPIPPDELRKKLAAALAKDADKSKLRDLIAVYKQGALEAHDERIDSSRRLIAVLRDVSADVLRSSDVLFNVRSVVAEELAATLGKVNDDPLTDAERKRAAELFTKAVVILEELAK